MGKVPLPWLEGGLLHVRFRRIFELYSNRNIIVADKRRLGWGIKG
jgi:hypothetical protein